VTKDAAMQLGLEPRHMQIVTDLLAEYVPSRPVWAFGSRTFGRARRYSDLDLAIGGTTPLPVSARFDLSDALDASMLPIEVDVIDLNDVDSSFRQRIAPDLLLIQE
jgi:predicted nucleotidyltransferase